jgi:type IV secretory pathway VirB6-like protein
LPDASGFFTISQTQSCIYKPGDAEPTCTLDTVNSLSSALNEAYKYPIMQGKLYLKIMDGYYEDNSGAYNVVVSYGAVSSIGVIESAIKGFEDTIVDAANAIRLAVSGNSSILEITRALLFFYIAINGLLFAMGMLQSNASELVKRLFKIGIIATAISPAAFDFFNVYIFSLIKDGFYAFSEMILDATHDPSNPLQASFAVAAGQTPLSVYDKILNAVTSNALHVKIWSLLFFKWGGVYIIAIYIGIFYILLALTKTVMMYIIATINMAILISLFPFFIVMILFEITKSFFDSWIKSFLANAVTIMLIFASIAIIMTLLFGLLQNLLAFKVCWKPVWDLPLLNKLYFWIPSSYSDVKNAVTMVNVLAFVIVAIVFDKFTSEVPTIGEAITGGSSGIKSAFEALSKVMKKALNAANALNPIGLAINRYNAMKNGEYSSTKTRDKLPISKGGSGKNGEGSDGKFKDGGKNPAVNKALAPHITPLYNPSQTVYYPTNVPILNGAPVNPIPAPVNLTTTPVNPIPAAEPRYCSLMIGESIPLIAALISSTKL